MAVAFNSFDTLLAPYVKEDGLTYEQVKQHMQNFIFSINSNSRGGCVPETTEVLTPSGFRKYTELQVGQEIYVWKNGVLDIEPIKQMNIFDYDSELICFEGRDYIQTVTPNHRVVKKIFNANRRNRLDNPCEIKYAEELENLKTGMSLPVGCINKFSGISLSDEEIMLAVFILTEGCIEDSGRIRIYKSPERWGNEELKNILDSLDIDYTKHERMCEVSCEPEYGKYKTFRYDISQSQFHNLEHLVPHGKKDIAEIFLKMNQEQAQSFLETWARLDGHFDREYCQCDNMEIANKLQHIAFLAGYGSRCYERLQNGNKKPTIYVRWYKRKFKSNNKTYRIKYKGKVWCPTTDAGVVVFRESGKVFVSGNSEPAFSNLTFDLTPPSDLLNEPVFVADTVKDYTYKSCQPEMDMINRAFYELMLNGDANGRPFSYPVPTYNIHKRFDWDNPNNDLLFEMAGKYGYPYFANFINSDMDVSQIRSMCCRLSLRLDELSRRNGGLFGSGDSTGSCGVVTINLPRIAYLHANNEKKFFKELSRTLTVAKDSLEIKRKWLQENIIDKKMIPAFCTYVGTLNNHFSTIGVVGMNEMCENYFGEGTDILTEKGKSFSIKVSNFIRDKLLEFQQETGNLYNYEATPAESTAYRLAKKDREEFDDIITRGTPEAPYYTNSCHIPVGKVENIKQLFDHQDDLQVLFTGGTVIHNYLNGAITGIQAKEIVRTICEKYRTPYISLSPLNRYCSKHGYIEQRVDKCPKCGEPLELYQRITGYLRRAPFFNAGKKSEFSDRQQMDL